MRVKMTRWKLAQVKMTSFFWGSSQQNRLSQITPTRQEACKTEQDASVTAIHWVTPLSKDMSGLTKHNGVSKDKINHFCDSTSKLWKAATQLNGEDWTRMKLCWHCQWQCCCVDNDNAFQWHGLSKSGTRGNSVCDAVGHENDDDDTDDYMDMDNGYDKCSYERKDLAHSILLW